MAVVSKKLMVNLLFKNRIVIFALYKKEESCKI